jgi:hypothetical protein
VREKLINQGGGVKDLYHKTGWAAWIAKSALFEQMTFFMIFVNAVWLAVDADKNDADLLLDADPLFIIAENLFCVYFSVELLIRFLAFKGKRNCFKDRWFIFDIGLVLMMIMETWVLSVVLWASGSKGTSGMGNLSILRVVRIAKMFRLARMARLLRMVPELVVIMTGIGVAARSVFFFSLLLLIIVYVYGVALRQITKNTDIGHEFFRTVPWAMNSLLLEGLFPERAETINTLSDAMPALYPIAISFVVLAAITIMYMLVGVLVEVVRAVSETEKEKLMVTDVSCRLRMVMDQFMDREKPGGRAGPGRMFPSFWSHSSAPDVEESRTFDNQTMIDQGQFQTFVTLPHVAQIIRDVGVDVEGLLDMSSIIYENLQKQGATGLSFADFIELILNMRGTNPVTVKDVNAQLRVVKGMFKDSTESLHKHIHDVITNLRNDLNSEVSSELRTEESSESEAGEVVVANTPIF